MSGEITIQPGDGSKGYFYHLVGANGEVMVSSEIFATKWSRDRSVRRLSAEIGLEVAPPEKIPS